jgi:hyperosmotically inducible periplasmic protein
VDATVNSGASGGAAPTAEAGAAASPPIDDAALVTTIQAKFFLDSSVKQGTVDVSSKDGIVLLQGTVPTEAAHQQALTIARTTEGVVQVVDRLQVQQPAPKAAARPRRR